MFSKRELVLLCACTFVFATGNSLADEESQKSDFFHCAKAIRGLDNEKNNLVVNTPNGKSFFVVPNSDPNKFGFWAISEWRQTFVPLKRKKGKTGLIKLTGRRYPKDIAPSYVNVRVKPNYDIEITNSQFTVPHYPEVYENKKLETPHTTASEQAFRAYVISRLETIYVRYKNAVKKHHKAGNPTPNPEALTSVISECFETSDGPLKRSTRRTIDLIQGHYEANRPSHSPNKVQTIQVNDGE